MKVRRSVKKFRGAPPTKPAPSSPERALRWLQIVFYDPTDFSDTGARLALIKLHADGRLEVISEQLHIWRTFIDQRRPHPHVMIPVRVLEYTKTPKGKVPKSVDYAPNWTDVLAARRESKEIHFMVCDLNFVPATWPEVSSA